MIRPQVPLRTPCYNLARLAKLRIVAIVSNCSSSKLYSAGLMVGVCKAQGLIHRAIMTRDYWGFHFHEGELQPSIRTGIKFKRLPCSFEVGAHCLNQCRPRVAQEIRAIQIYRCPFLPQSCLCSLLRVHIRNLMIATKNMGLARCLS